VTLFRRFLIRPGAANLGGWGEMLARQRHVTDPPVRWAFVSKKSGSRPSQRLTSSHMMLALVGRLARSIMAMGVEAGMPPPAAPAGSAVSALHPYKITGWCHPSPALPSSASLSFLAYARHQGHPRLSAAQGQRGFPHGLAPASPA